MAIDTDYSFLNLPQAGSSARGPIARPSFDPVDFSFNVDRYAPSNLPDVEMVAPSPTPLSSNENQAVLTNARPFEDVETLGATFGARLAETERFFGERVSSLQGNIDDLINTKSDLTKQLEAAFLQQDEMSQQAIEEQIAALDAQRAELVAQLEQSVSEAEANGVDAVAAAEQVAAEQIATLDQQIAQTSQELQEALAQQDVIRAEESEKRLLELENQKVTLTDQFTQQQTALQEQFGQREAELTGTIDSLQGEINNITGARDSAIAERDEAIAQQDTIRAESAEAQAQALDAQANDYQAQLDQLTGQSTQYQGQVTERDQTIADLQAQLEGLQQPAATDTSLLDARRKELEDIGYDAADVEEILERDQQRGLENVTSNVLPDLIAKQPPVIPPRPPQLPPKMKDPIFIDDRPGFIDDKQPPIKVPGGTPGFYDRKGPIAKDPRIPDPREKFISYEREPLVPIFKPSPIKAPPPKMSVGGIGGFSGKRTGRMARR